MWLERGNEPGFVNQVAAAGGGEMALLLGAGAKLAGLMPRLLAEALAQVSNEVLRGHARVGAKEVPAVGEALRHV